MVVKSGQVWTGSFATADSTGALLASTSAPTAVLYVNGVLNAAAVTVTGSNPYKWSLTLPSLTAGDTVEIYASATIATIPVSVYVAAATADTSRPSDVAAELAKVPKSDSTVSWNATALAAILTQVSSALNVAIPGSPTADSINERVKAIDDRILGTLAAGTHAAQTGDSYPVVTHTDYGNAKLVRSTTPANTLDVSATGEAGVDWANVGSPTTSVALTGTQVNSVLGSVGSVSTGVTIAGTLGTLDALWLKIQKWLRLGFRKDSAVATDHAVELGEINANTGTGVGAYTSTTDSQEALRDRGDAAWLSGSAPSTTDIDTALSATHGAGAWGAGTGVFSKVYTVTSGGLPVDGVYCRLTTDEAGLVDVDAGTTNAAGQVTFHHNLAAGTTVYIHRSKAGFTPVAPEPDVEVI